MHGVLEPTLCGVDDGKFLVILQKFVMCSVSSVGFSLLEYTKGVAELCAQSIDSHEWVWTYFVESNTNNNNQIVKLIEIVLLFLLFSDEEGVGGGGSMEVWSISC